MKPSDELFNLIKSLTKTEKRFFKLQSSLQSGDKNYLKIFSFIDTQDNYDEESVKNHFKNERFIKHFPSEKNHLYKQLLKSLRAYHADNSISSILKEEIKNIEVLYKKALFKECNKFLKRAKKMAQEHEKFYYWFELISWEKALLEEAFEAGEFGTGLDPLVEEEHLVIEKLRNLAEYHILYSKINYIFRIGGFVKSPEEREMVEEISNHALISGKNTALSNRAASICYYIKGFCSAANRNTEESFEFFSKAKYILDQNPQLRKDLGKRYVRTIANLIQVEIRSKRFDEATRLIGEVEALKGTTGFNSTDLEVILYYTSSLAKLLLFIRQGKFEDSLVLMEAITTNFEKYGSKINKEQEVVFNYVFAYCYFGAQQYNKALSCINKILNDNENTLRQDVYAYARIFNLVIHYELNNVDLLYYIIKSTQRYLGKQDQSFMVEKLLVDFFKKAIKPLKDEKESELFEEFYTELKKLFTDDSQRVILEYFDFNSWIKSKITKTSFQELITEKGSAT
ncbi:MAG: hypothetical protein ACJAUV_001041 [Flavobacteriales bacterium]|jgi:hypothetical protein